VCVCVCVCVCVYVCVYIYIYIIYESINKHPNSQYPGTFPTRGRIRADFL